MSASIETTENSLDNQSAAKRRMITYLLLMLFLMAYSAMFTFYTAIARSTVPIMDFWRWIYKFGSSCLNGSMSLTTFLQDGGEHSQALNMYIIFSVLKRHHFNVQPLVYYGCAVISCQGMLLLVYFLQRCKNDRNSVYLLTGGILTVMIVFNYNAWEMVTEPFSLMAEIRTLIFFLLFIFTDRLFIRFNDGEKSKREMILCFAVLGSIYCAVGLLISGGHSIALLLTYFLANLVWSLDNRKRMGARALIPLLLSTVAVFATALIYFLNLKAGDQTVSAKAAKLWDYARGFIIGIGSAVVHQGQQAAFFIGAAVVLLVGIGLSLIVFFMNAELRRKLLFPFMCLIFGGISIAVICYGRVGSFGANYTASSRYTVEKNFGLLGLAWLLCEVGGHIHAEKMLKRIVFGTFAAAVCCTMVYFLVLSATEEWKMAPYRGAYYTQLANMMRNIDAYTDDQLGSFQSDAAYVRGAIRFLVENHLSIFR